MKRRIKIFLSVAVFLFLIVSPVFNAEAYSLSGAEAVMEVMSGRLLAERNAEEKLPMASTTKIVTAITVLDNFDSEKIITVPKECVGVEGSSIYLKANERYRVIDLLYGLMLRSGNDAAETLAVALSGSIRDFTLLMNDTARKVGANNSSFTNPHGLSDDNHYTTAKDLAMITCYAMKNETFRKIVSAKKHVAKEVVSGENKVWVNKNKMLFNFDGADGVKTGYTVKAGRCLVSSARRDGMEIVSVVLNSPQMFGRSAELLENAFSEYDLLKVIDSERFDYNIFDEQRSIAYKLSKPETFYYPVGKNEKIRCETDFTSFPDKSPEPNEKVGEIKIYCSKQLIFSQNIYTLSNV